ncbi:DUF3718 domain-containing protein [Aliiglaciecola lipolytica]|uniref:DUF3718 domain-containing protein n=1 Tax=Aliiglaciecola lipolytica TaxID=477689 RepID=UPI000590955E|nr:DUF3718 domain-containing protein [Aliiglaciecola lipolytica]
MAVAFVLGAFATHSANAATSFTPTQEASLVKICKALKSDSRIKLNNAIKSSNLSYKLVANGLMCNGKSALEFAVMHEAQKTAGLLARKANINYDEMLAKR